MADFIQQSIFPSVSQATAGSASSIVGQAVGLADSEERTQLVEDFDTFLQLLVTQIQNQDPTNPTDTQAFTDQLVQFSELEQQILSNDSLDDILTTIQSQNAASVVSYIGSTVTADGTTTTLNNGQAIYNLNVSQPVPNAQIEIRDARGAVVFEETRSLEVGNNEFIFEGTGPAGQQFNDGEAFTIRAIGDNEQGGPVSISTSISGVVDGVDFSGAVPSLRVGPATIPLDTVTSVNAPPNNNNS